MITVNESKKYIKLDTPHTSYILGLIDGKYLAHIFYGHRIGDTDLTSLLRTDEGALVPSQNPGEEVSFLGSYAAEYSFGGTGDFRESCIGIRTEEGHTGLALLYRDYRIFHGKKKIPGLPASFGDNCDTLEVTLEDPVTGLAAVLCWSVFDDVDVITRSVSITNRGTAPFHLTRALSAGFDMEQRDYEVLSFSGAWAREHKPERTPLTHAGIAAESRKGEEGHETQPFIGLVSGNCGFDTGEVYAMHLVYSGNFLGKVQQDAFGKIRMVIGIHPENFAWKLVPGETFYTPEAVLTYSCAGLNGMTHNLHDFYRSHLIRSPWQFRSRPVLINNWEATYFDFDEAKILAIAEKAAQCGIDMIVMDDGWFGEHRNQPESGLGDWFVNEQKIRGGLRHLVRKVHAMHMKFGLWFEPEMISEDSRLYRAHPDWCLREGARRPGQCRGQLVLDFSRPEVLDYLYHVIAGIIEDCGLDYIKWDMNRPLADAGSAALPADRQGEVPHRHVLGLYALEERLLERFPELLLENCSSGGARFDPGMLYYSPQIWCSDDMDPVERLSIFEGTAMLYPVSSIGSHVAKDLNDITGRKTPFSTRARMAMAGTFGYELDITKLPAEEVRQIPGQIRAYRKLQPLLEGGDYYRIASYADNHEYDCFAVVSKDRAEAAVFLMQVLFQPNTRSRIVHLAGLEEDAVYEVSGTCSDVSALALETGEDPEIASKTITMRGDALMYAGVRVQMPKMDFAAKILRVRRMDG